MQTQISRRLSRHTFRSRTSSIASAIFALSVAAASAHPGHDWNAQPVSHFLTSPYHLLILTALGIGLLLGAAFVKRLAARRAMQVTGVAALLIAVATAATQLFH